MMQNKYILVIKDLSQLLAPSYYKNIWVHSSLSKRSTDIKMTFGSQHYTFTLISAVALLCDDYIYMAPNFVILGQGTQLSPLDFVPSMYMMTSRCSLDFGLTGRFSRIQFWVLNLVINLSDISYRYHFYSLFFYEKIYI